MDETNMTAASRGFGWSVFPGWPLPSVAWLWGYARWRSLPEAGTRPGKNYLCRHPAQDQLQWRAHGESGTILRAAAYLRGRLVWMVRPQWPYPAAREQTLSDESSGAGEVAGEARAGQGASPQANAV